MYDNNFRSYIRTMIRKEAQHYQSREGKLPIAEISKAVVDKLTTHKPTDSEWLESLYSLVYEEAKELLRRPGQNKNNRVEQQELINLGVPQKQAKAIVTINRVAVYVPSVHALKLLYGPDRLTRDELGQAIAHYRKKSGELHLLADQLERLFRIPGYYQ